MFPALLSSTLVVLLAAIGWTTPPAAAPESAQGPGAQTLFDEILDPAERALFRRVWETAEPRLQRDLAARFVTDHPRSVVLREACEIAALASAAAGDAAGALAWGKRALRLLPENVSLLVMVADLAAKQHDPVLAERSARVALRLLETAVPPPPLPAEQWTAVRNGLRATAHAVLGRVAADRDDYAAAERSLLTALGWNAQETEAAFLLGVVRVAVGNDAAAAPPLAHVMREGGRLTGAAGELLRGIQARQSPASQLSFDAYVASRRWVSPPPPQPLPRHPLTPDRYAGSMTCRGCHAREYERWQATGMAKMLRAYEPGNIIGDFSGQQTVNGSARAVLDGGRHFIEIRKGDGQEWTRHAVDYTIGSKWQQAYATRLADQRLLVFPIQYSRKRGAWLNYWKVVDAPGSARADIARFHEVPEALVYQKTCAPCHTSQLAFPKGAGQPAAAAFHEGGVNCEMCHGPSRSHVDGMKTGTATRGADIDPPVRFGRISAEQSVAICAQCHAQSAVHDAEGGGEVNYAVAGPWYRTYPTHLLSSFPRTALYRDGRFRATTFISEAFARSQCFQTGQATCASCHNPHPADAATNPTSLKFGEDGDQMCLQCHTRFKDAPERHTRHATGTEAGRCVSCHMPRIADALLFQARSHQIDDIPDAALTAQFGQDDSPNACLTCHRDRNSEWLARAMAARAR